MGKKVEDSIGFQGGAIRVFLENRYQGRIGKRGKIVPKGGLRGIVLRSEIGTEVIVLVENELGSLVRKFFGSGFFFWYQGRQRIEI